MYHPTVPEPDKSKIEREHQRLDVMSQYPDEQIGPFGERISRNADGKLIVIDRNGQLVTVTS